MIVEGERTPTRISAAVFKSKATALQLRRATRDVITGTHRWPCSDSQRSPLFSYVLAESRTPLWSDDNAAEGALQQGKVQNLRCALRRLNGASLPSDGVFSFWKQIGQATRRCGYAPGRLLREGCLMPAVGGGLCQLSNALYDAALRSGCEIVERHAHSQIVPGSAAQQGRDATVAWNYIDLRFRPAQALLIEAFLTPDELVLRFRGDSEPSKHAAGFVPLVEVTTARPTLDMAAHSCATCAAATCFRHGAPVPHSPSGRSAFLLDECWPEWKGFVASRRAGNDVLAIPLNGTLRNRRNRRQRQSRAAWDSQGWARVHTATAQALARSLAARRHRHAGAARLKAQLRHTRNIARRLARALSPDVTQLYVAQALLPFLWRDGHLGGRTFSVLMTRLPLETLHARLNAALCQNPDRATLGEYRAPAWIVEAESGALRAAERVVTPHHEIAALFGDKAIRLDWHQPPCKTSRRASQQDKSSQQDESSSRTIAFPGPTAARKGAYEVRDVARALDLEVVPGGSELEGADFWRGVRTRSTQRADRAGNAGHWLDGVAIVVQPALVEDNPRRLLEALACGVPVVATSACGLGERAGVVTVPGGDGAALQAALCRILHRRQTGET